uniref:Uncharacterized protein n=1 Tax=Athene cunicularia TaxID=194338 RepID=A0A663LKS1_ATHCN
MSRCFAWGNLSVQFPSARVSGGLRALLQPPSAGAGSCQRGASGPARAIATVPSAGGCPELAAHRDLHLTGCFLESTRMEIGIINVHTRAHSFIFM